MTPIDNSKRDALKVLGAGTAVSVLGTGTAAAKGPAGGPVLESKRMVGNTLTGADGAIRGVNAGGAPWIIDDGRAKLHADGKLRVRVRGLVLDPERVPTPPDGPGGTNPIAQFRAIVSCLVPDGDGHVVQNVRTSTVPADEDGDAEIRETIDVPDSCLAPIVFVAGAEETPQLDQDLWFAVTGA